MRVVRDWTSASLIRSEPTSVLVLVDGYGYRGNGNTGLVPK